MKQLFLLNSFFCPKDCDRKGKNSEGYGIKLYVPFSSYFVPGNHHYVNYLEYSGWSTKILIDLYLEGQLGGEKIYEAVDPINIEKVTTPPHGEYHFSSKLGDLVSREDIRKLCHRHPEIVRGRCII